MSLSMASVLTALRMAYNHDEVAQGVVLVGGLQIQERLLPASLMLPAISIDLRFLAKHRPI